MHQGPGENRISSAITNSAAGLTAGGEVLVHTQRFHGSQYLHKSWEERHASFMPSETVPPADPPLRSNGSTLRQKRFPISKLKCAIEQSKNKLQDTDIQLVKIQEVAERSGHLYSDLAGDLIVHRTR